MAWYIHQATVHGKGAFPLDMLRHDRCFPHTQRDVLDLSASITGRDPGYVVTVTKCSARKEDGFTPERWASFGATLSAGTPRRVEG